MVDVRVTVTDETVISACNTPGGPIFQWRDETAESVIQRAIATAPVNDPLNALHRGGGVGEFRASFYWSRVGSNGHRVRAAMGNVSDHAIYAEEGRGASTGWEMFSWSGHSPPGEIGVHPRGTRGYKGHHTLKNAVNAVMPGATGGAYSPLP